MQLLAEGNANKSASARLRVSLKTVETRREAATRKPGLRSTANLVRSACETA